MACLPKRVSRPLGPYDRFFETCMRRCALKRFLIS